MPDDESGAARSVIEQARYDRRRKHHWTLDDAVSARVLRAARAIERDAPGDRERVERQTRELSMLLLDGLDDVWSCDDALHQNRQWDPEALEQWLCRPSPGREADGRPLDALGDGLGSDGTGLVAAFRSLACIAEHEDHIKEELKSRVDAVGFATKLGVHLQDADMDIGDPVGLVTEESGALKTLFTGGTGQGKSAALEAEAEDYYLRNAVDGEESVKLIDLVGLRDGENWFYDIPQQDPPLRDAREDLGLPPSFEDAELMDRDLEILVPLTPGLNEQSLPYDSEADQFRVRPFTVPAAAIRKPLLVSMIVTKLTPQQEAIVRTAYDDINRANDDWTLKDLAEAIKRRDELGPDKKKPIIGTLRQLQGHGFIRTHEDAYTIDWREIFESTETVTVFSQAFMEDTIAQLIAFGYLAHTVVKKRQRLHDVPPCALLMRELWKVAPHNRRQEFDNRAAALQEAIGHMLAALFRENRHSGVHVLADTQQPSDLLKPVREMFNRYVVFQTNESITRDIFEWTANNKWRAFYNTLTPKKGEASVVGMTEPAVEERHIEFVGPVKYAPAAHHHRIAGIDTTGWTARCKYVESEELRRPADVPHVTWDDDVPPTLIIDGEDEDAGGAPDVDTKPVAAFVHDCIAYTPGEPIKKSRITTAFNEFVEQHGRSRWNLDEHGVKSRFGKRFKNAIDGEVGQTKVEGDSAYKNVSLNASGEALYQDAMEGLESSAAPITGDD